MARTRSDGKGNTQNQQKLAQGRATRRKGPSAAQQVPESRPKRSSAILDAKLKHCPNPACQGWFVPGVHGSCGLCGTKF
jgi:hypothetical protein